MTYIPGTGTINIPKNTPKRLNELKEPDFFTVVNVDETQKPKEAEADIEPAIWYLQLKYWLAFGFGVSILFALFSILDYRFLFLLPLGPYATYVGWHIRKKIKKYAEKLDAFN